MKMRAVLAALAIVTLTAGAAYAAAKYTVTPSEFDPGNTFLVQAQWLDGIGCPASFRSMRPRKVQRFLFWSLTSDEYSLKTL